LEVATVHNSEKIILLQSLSVLLREIEGKKRDFISTGHSQVEYHTSFSLPEFSQGPFWQKEN
jgi:hypothetical protein